jgi:hypothetical protein
VPALLLTGRDYNCRGLMVQGPAVVGQVGWLLPRSRQPYSCCAALRWHAFGMRLNGRSQTLVTLVTLVAAGAGRAPRLANRNPCHQGFAVYHLSRTSIHQYTNAHMGATACFCPSA